MSDVQPVGAVRAEVALTKRAYKITFLIEHDDGVFATGEDINVVPGVHRNTGTLLEGSRGW